jgi:two-component system response regulator HydG
MVVDDVVDMAQTIANELESAGFHTEVAGSGAAALESFAGDPADVVVTDLRMKSVDGLDVLAGVRRADPTVPVILMTAFGGVESAVEAMRRGAFHYVTKPFELATLVSLVERAARERTLTRENAQLRNTLHANAAARQLLGRSTAMQQMRALIERVAGSQSSVLVSGETGTGKELVALAIHADGARSERPFVAVNCAALPEHLLESELFGHARGAFTGASQSRRGLFVEADEGTLLLDEIGDLPLPLQGKLLRVLQSGEIRPVGTESRRIVDVRCIAATHKDLAELVRRGLFREDLYFRLDVLRVQVPALRERTEDIPLLTEHFLQRSLAAAPRSVLQGFEPEAMEFLVSYDWPGNVRQLQNLVERLVVTASTPLAPLTEVKRATNTVRDSDPIASLIQRPLRLDDLERRYIAAVLDRVGGSKTKAAEILGVDPSTLYRREKPKG